MLNFQKFQIFSNFFCFKFKAGDLVDVLINDEEGRFATLVVAVQAAELVETLQGGNKPIKHNLNFYKLN
jgi:hypothetical protein